MGFSRQEYWSGLPFPSPADLPDPGIKLGSAALQGDDGVIFCFFSSWGATCGVSLELRWGTHGSSRVSREVQSQFELRGEPGIVLESRQGNRASRQFEGESQGLSQVVAGKHGFPQLVTLTSRSLSWCLWEVRNTVELGGASWDSTGVGAMEEGLILS